MLSPRFLSLPLLTALVVLAFSAESRAQIYADVTVGGGVSGTFTIMLEHAKTPNAVASFVGLATGQRGWLDVDTGAICTDGFYNGVTFHRVIYGAISQTGSRVGDGSDGPGYIFRNEIDASLTHNGPYVVAMANSGKDTNGSQWYVTAAPQAGLDGGYTVFGHVTSGTAVCDAINAVPTSAERPLTDVIIQSVVVYGPSYAGFNVNPTSLPRLVNATPEMKKSGATFALGYDHHSFSEYFGYHSADLATWTRFTPSLSYFSQTAPTPGDLDVTSLVGLQHYFRMGRADYSTCANLFVPANLAGKSLHFSNPLAGTLVVNASGTGGAWFFDSGGAFGLIGYNAFPRPYSGYLYIQLSNGTQISFDRLEYSSATTGTFVGRTDVPGFANVSGSFTSTP